MGYDRLLTAPIVPLVNGHLLERLIPDSRLRMVRGGGHLFLLERPAEIATDTSDNSVTQTIIRAYRIT
jgi:pimeloyl-ACP methyl ester carboxylesterase